MALGDSDKAAEVERPWRTLLFAAAAWILATAAGAACFSRIDRHGADVDFIAFWTGARALSEGRNPYDAEVLKSYVPETGYESVLKQHTGDKGHMPYYYPIWFLFPLVPLTPLGFHTARSVWDAWLAQGYVLTLLLTFFRVRGPLKLAATLAAGLTLTWVYVLRLGQPVALMLPAALFAMFLWDRGRDAASGATVAFLLTKPHLGLFPAAATFVGALRRGRPWAAAAAFGVPAVLGLVGLLVFPAWPWEFLAAPSKNAVPSANVMGVNVTLWEFLRYCLGDQGAGRTASIAVQATVAALLTAGLGQLALDRRTPMERPFAAAFLIAFFIFPYMRFYDLQMLLVVATHLVNRRPDSRATTIFLLVWWLGMPVVEVFRPMLLPDRSNTQMDDGWLVLWTAVWWLWDAFAPPSPKVEPAMETSAPTAA